MTHGHVPRSHRLRTTRLTIDQGRAVLHTRGTRMEKSLGPSSPASLVSGRWLVTCTFLALCLACNADSAKSSSSKTWITCVSGNQTSGEQGCCSQKLVGRLQPGLHHRLPLSCLGPSPQGKQGRQPRPQVDSRPHPTSGRSHSGQGTGKRLFTWFSCDGCVLFTGFIRAHGTSKMGTAPSSSSWSLGGSLVCAQSGCGI